MEMEPELIGLEHGFDTRGETKKEKSLNVRLSVWITSQMVRPFTEERKTKWGQVRESKVMRWGFPGGAVVENPPANAGDTGSSPGLGRSHMPRSN